MPTIPSPITALPTAPSRGDPSSFAIRGDAFLGALGGFGSDLSALGTVTYNNAVDAFSSATTASNAAVSATSASSIALGASNFKGEWSSLTGALAKPASVHNGGRFWLLLNNLADVTTSTPGVSADWVALDSGTNVTQVITTNTTAVAGVRYIIAATGITLTAPTTWLKGDYFGVREAISTGTYTIDFGTTKVRGATYGATLMTASAGQIDLNYEDATRGLV